MIFLKLGGSLITDKALPGTARFEALARLAAEIAAARRAEPSLRILVGHGSGSFGHVAAAAFRTHEGATTSREWLGFAAVWRSANRLNRMVVDALADAGNPVISFPPSASAVAVDGQLESLALSSIVRALAHGLVPLVQGDVSFDTKRGACILSTEAVFAWLAPVLQPTRILLAGADEGVFADYPRNTRLVETFSQDALQMFALEGSAQTDVTGGMAEKVRSALAMSRADPAVEVRIFSGEVPGRVQEALLGARAGTQVVWSPES
ncbi:MAG TPA: isopentenyl phosphate kinase [Anaerolineales bacterium]|nr:isopentenyl phosphate kinase [Anaerolineales bacterium]